MKRKKTMEDTIKDVEIKGVQPYWLGFLKRDDGPSIVVEFVSLPWVAGRDVFVLVQQPNKPHTIDCVHIKDITPLNMTNRSKVSREQQLAA